MIGKPIRSEGSRDVASVQDLGDRLAVVSSRRHEVIMLNVLAWILAAALAIAIGRRRAARVALPLLGLTVVYMPLVLLATAEIEPSRMGERLAVGLGAPLLAAVTFALLRGYAALAVACGLTVGAYALDVILGSPLTKLSLLGPNPAIGVRFFGIGNELEATLAVLVPAGVGAALAAWGPSAEDLARRRGAIAFLAAGGIAALVFGLGRFGADVGAVIVLPAGAAVAAAVAAGTGRRRGTVLLIAAAPVLALALLGGARPDPRRRRASDQLRAARRRRPRPRRRRPAADRALGEELRPQRDLALPLHHRRGAGAGFRLPPADRRATRRADGLRRFRRRRSGDGAGHGRQRLGRRAADDRHRVPPRLRGVRSRRSARPETADVTSGTLR